MSKSKNLSVFYFGENLNMMFEVILGISRIKVESGILYLNQRLNMGNNQKITTLNISEIDNVKMSDYSIVVVDSDINDKLIELASLPENEEVVFIICTKTDEGINEKAYTYIDFAELSKMSIIKKISKVNEIRKTLNANKTLKKMKFF